MVNADRTALPRRASSRMSSLAAERIDEFGTRAPCHPATYMATTMVRQSGVTPIRRSNKEQKRFSTLFGLKHLWSCAHEGVP